jgi:hypothetical protein
MTAMATLTLAEFLLARIDDDKAWVQMVLDDYAQHLVNWSCPVTGVVNVGDPGMDGLLPTGDGPLAQHIARWDPARVLAECDAKRRIIELFRETTEGEDGISDDADFLRQMDEIATGRWEALRSVIRLLALPYADHPDYREEWRP